MTKLMVQSDAKAVELLKNYAKKNDLTCNVKNSSSRCECGETKAFEIFDSINNVTVKIGVCESCGDDNNFDEEVVEII